MAILGGIIFVLIAVIILSIVVCFSKNRARYYTREDHLNGSEYSYEIAKYLTVLITQKKRQNKTRNRHKLRHLRRMAQRPVILLGPTPSASRTGQRTRR